jgi:hypothetical protein
MCILDQMSRNETVVFTDDLTGEEGADTVFFALDAVLYSIDLTPASRAKLEEALAPFIAAATPFRPESTKRKAKGPDPTVVRNWARTQGLPIGDRGRVPAKLVAAYEKAKP